MSGLLYLSADPKKAAVQIEARRELHLSLIAQLPDPSLVIEVLVQVIHHPREDAATIAGRLGAAGRVVTRNQVEEVFRAYGVKKRPGGRWRPRRDLVAAPGPA